jgi:hypothetical protein
MHAGTWNMTRVSSFRNTNKNKYQSVPRVMFLEEILYVVVSHIQTMKLRIM